VPDPKRDAIELLEELRDLTILDEGDPQAFRVRAYESAKHAVEGFAGDISKLSAAELQKIDGIGKSTAGKLRELFDGGRVQKLEDLRAKHPQGVVDLMRIPGLGPKAIRRLRTELGVQSIDDLRRVIAEHRIRELKGFGKTSEEKLEKSLERMAAAGGEKRTPIAVALPLAERLVAELAAVKGVHVAAYCGSLRRFSETVGDLDIVAAADEGAPVMETVLGLPVVDRILAQGAGKSSFVTRRGLQVDVRVVAPHQIGAALMYFTGSKGHNIKMRQRALERKLTLNEYALSEIDGGKVVASETEEEIYAALGLPFIHPVLREDMGEIDLAERGELPRVIDGATLRGDFHVHTSVSGDGRSDLEEVVAAAKERGYAAVAITEHAEKLSMNGVSRDALLEQRAQIAALQRSIGPSMKILHGIELNIGAEGELDYDDAFRRELDFCLASIHDHFDLDRAAQTRRVIRAMEDPSVRMIGHLSARMLGGRPGVDLDIGAILDAAERTDTALEVNGGLPRLDVSLDVMRAARGRKVNFVLTSDAHHSRELRRVEFAALHASKAWLPEARVVNAWPPEQMLAWAAARG
jgi:DNA polymerase (family 10)